MHIVSIWDAYPYFLLLAVVERDDGSGHVFNARQIFL